MPYNRYHQVSRERYDILCERYQNYLAVLNDPTTEPVKVFDPLNAKQLEELELIREVSKDLEKKKIEELNKAAQAELAAKAEAEKKAAEEAEAAQETPQEA